MPSTHLATTASGTVPVGTMADAVRVLAMDAVERAKSGHPGMPMGMAAVATVLWSEFMSFDPSRPDWPDRDRFVLSAGYGSMLLYALLHLTGYEGVTVEELQRFRQLGAKTAGHPEWGQCPGVETTTGPLGQGLANAVGMAVAEKRLRARFGEGAVDHWTWVIAGDGCFMEGISHEAGSLAGHLGLDRLVVLFDDNGISIDGPTSLACSDDHLARFASYGWQTLRVDGHDPNAIREGLASAKADPRPSLIACRTVIGRGAPTKGGTAATHGSPLGAEEVARTREALGWTHPAFEIPEEIRTAWRRAGTRGSARREAWEGRVRSLPPDDGAEFRRAIEGTLPDGWRDALRRYIDGLVAEAPSVATRKASEAALEVLTSAIPEMVGGSADLTGSNNTKTKSTSPFAAGDPVGRYVHHGVREHAMGAAMNGMAIHGGVIPYGGTFLVFSDYCRPAIRLAALMGLRTIWVMTHDSIGLGEDGPTHQPVEHLASLRAMPNLLVLRPADAVEMTECWAIMLNRRDGPSLLALSRQNLPTLRREAREDNACALGAYVLSDPLGGRDATILATGSEVQVAMGVRDPLAASNLRIAVVSMPSMELFDRQPAAYRRAVLGSAPRVAVEAASPFGWARYVGDEDRVVGMRSFGASARLAT